MMIPEYVDNLFIRCWEPISVTREKVWKKLSLNFLGGWGEVNNF